MKSHVIVTNLYYDDEEMFKKRYEVYVSETLSRLKKQKNKEFDIAILCLKKHNHIIEKLGISPINYKKEDIKKRPFGVAYNEITGLKKYDIISSIDSDDLVSEGYTQKIIEEIEKATKEKDCSVSVTFQPRLFDLNTKEEKRMKKFRYSAKKCSMFYSVYMPNQGHNTIRKHPHSAVSVGIEKNVFVDEGFCWMGINDYNSATTMSA